MTISRAQVHNTSRSRVFPKLTADQTMVFDWIACSCPGRIVWKPANASPGLKFSQIITFSSIQMFFFLLLLLCFMFIKFKIKNLIAKLQNSNQNFPFSWVSLIGFSTTWPEGATLLGWPKSIYYFINSPRI